jgi:AcrR family transcriptional regulator
MRLTRMVSAATQLFLKDGYDKTSIDAILERSGGSKATLYAYFPTKQDLFRAVIEDVLVGGRRVVPDPQRADIDGMLLDFGIDRLQVVFSERHRAVLRLIIAERERFPDLARLYHERAPQRGHRLLVKYLDDLNSAGRLAIEDTDEAAEFFIGMLLHRWYKELLLLDAPTPSDAEIRCRTQRTVEVFLRAYQRAH